MVTKLPSFHLIEQPKENEGQKHLFECMVESEDHGWNQAIDAAIEALRNKGFSMDDYNGRIALTEIEKLKKP